MDERGKLSGYHGEEPGSQAEAKRKNTELVNLPFEGQPEKSPGLRVNGNVEVCILQIYAVHLDSLKNRPDGLTHGEGNRL